MLKRRVNIVKFRQEILPVEKDVEIADWILSSIDLGFIITRQLIKEKAKEIINEKFAAFISWLQGFFHRNLLILRCLNEKNEQH